jgi:hypothetical protein
MHPRIFIRNKFVAALLNATDCGDKVFKNRARPFINIDGWLTQLPALVVFTNNESSTQVDAAPARWERRATITVEIHAGADEDTDDLLDHISEQVETIIGRIDWEPDEMSFNLLGTQMAVRDVGESRITGACSISFEITYYSYLPDAGKSDGLDDFITAANTYRIGTADNFQTVTLP